MLVGAGLNASKPNGFIPRFAWRAFKNSCRRYSAGFGCGDLRSGLRSELRLDARNVGPGGAKHLGNEVLAVAWFRRFAKRKLRGWMRRVR